jgi:hypothetical protein
LGARVSTDEHGFLEHQAKYEKTLGRERRAGAEGAEEEPRIFTDEHGFNCLKVQTAEDAEDAEV